MSKQYGLIVPNKKQEAVTKPKIFGSDSEDEAPVAKPKLNLGNTLKAQDKSKQLRAVEEDPTVYQYDEIYDEMDKSRKALLASKSQDRKPKYITKLLAAAERRKKDNERRIERQVQKERETEGDEFKDKESFVTSAYKKKLEEMKDMEEQEKREEYLEEVGNVRKQGNLDGFYRHLYDQKVNYEDKLREEAVKQEIKQEPEEPIQNPEPEETKEQDDPTGTVPKSKRRKYRQREESDDEEETNLKDHLQSNIDADSDFSIDSSDEDTNKEAEIPPAVEQIEDTPQVPPKDEKIETEQEEPPKPEPKVKIDIWKKRTTDEVFTAALLRYQERKLARAQIIF